MLGYLLFAIVLILFILMAFLPWFEAELEKINEIVNKDY